MKHRLPFLLSFTALVLLATLAGCSGSTDYGLATPPVPAGTSAPSGPGKADLPLDGGVPDRKDGASHEGGDSTSNVVYGNVGNVQLKVEESSYLHGEGTNDFGRYVRKMSVALDDRLGICGRFAAGVDKPNSKVLWLTVTLVNLNGSTPIAPLTQTSLPIGSTTDANFYKTEVTGTFFNTDATCKNQLATSRAQATSGSVSFDSFDATSVKGRFDLYFPEGRLSGFFDAPVCATGITNGTLVCQP